MPNHTQNSPATTYDLSGAQETHPAGGDNAGPAPTPTPAVVRLSVNLAPGVARTLKRLAEEHGVTATEEIRRAIALDRLVSDALRDGHRVTVVEGSGSDAKFRDLVFL